MNKEDEIVLKITKEIVVKFIEVGRLSVASFEEVWDSIHRSVRRVVEERRSEGPPENPPDN